jgi:hypothetical protein
LSDWVRQGDPKNVAGASFPFLGKVWRIILAVVYSYWEGFTAVPKLPFRSRSRSIQREFFNLSLLFADRDHNQLVCVRPSFAKR